MLLSSVLVAVAIVAVVVLVVVELAFVTTGTVALSECGTMSHKCCTSRPVESSGLTEALHRPGIATRSVGPITQIHDSMLTG